MFGGLLQQGFGREKDENRVDLFLRSIIPSELSKWR